jgi:hypothetical protein
MDERPRPDLEHTREALRQHDEHSEEPVEEETAPEEPAAKDADEDED